MSWRMEHFKLTGMKVLVNGGGSGSRTSWRLASNLSMTSAGTREPGRRHTPRNWTMWGYGGRSSATLFHKSP
ncbi:hypothetical protein GBAR_LOCUS9989, partial [Geodia barretti]